MLGTGSSISLGRSCPSLNANGPSSVKQSADWYIMSVTTPEAFLEKWMYFLVRSLHCRSQQPTDLTRRYRFWPFPLLDTPVAVAGGRFDTPNRITERPFCEELHGHFWRRPFGLSDSKDSALQ